jgi:putative flippase GtrA
MATVHLSLSPQLMTGLAALIVSILTYVAENASQIVNPTYAPFVAFLAGAIAAFVTHNYYTPTPTANAGAPSTAAGPPSPPS